MASFERKMKAYLELNNYRFKDYCDSFVKPDFVLGLDHHRVSIDVKEKKQHYKNHWTGEIPEESLFIIDDLAARKVFMDSPYSAIIVFDYVTSKYHLFTALDMFMMPKIRVNRTFVGRVKGKWLVDLNNSYTYLSLTAVMSSLKEYVGFCDTGGTLAITACYGNYVGEHIPEAGTPRTVGQRNYDVAHK